MNDIAKGSIAVMLLFFPIASMGVESVKIRIQPEIEYQQIDGFGASGAWWAQHVGGWPEQEMDHIIRLLYGEEGAALSMYRFNIGAGGGREIEDPWRRTETFEAGAGTYDWERDANAIRVLRKIKGYGVNQYVFFANSPPARLTCSGMASGGMEGGPNLKPGAEDEFARYLVDITEYWKEKLSLANATVSPINEPQWKWGGDGRGQEGCHYTPMGAARLMRAVASEIERRKSSIHLEGPEVARWGHETLEYLGAILDEEGLAARLHRLAIHSYFSTRDEKAATVEFLEKRGAYPPIAVTEWCEMEHGRDTGMESALTMARVMHEDLTIANATSWQAWIAVSRYDYRDGLLYVDPETRNVVPTKRLWVAGQFARFITPNFVRIDATSDHSSVLVTGFRSPEKDEIVLVVINPEDEKRSVHYDWSPHAGGFTLKDVHVTSPGAELAEVMHTEGPVTLHKKSVTTIRLVRR